MSEASNVTNDTLADALRETQAAVNDLKAAQLHVKAVKDKWAERGVVKKALNDALKFRTVDEMEFQAQMSQFFRLRAVDGFAEAVTSLFQGLDLSPLGPETMTKHREAQCWDYGYQSALAAADRSSNQFVAGTPFFAAWERGWIKGHEVLTSTLPDKTEVADQRKERKPPFATPATVAAPAKPTAPAAANDERPEPMWDDQAQADAEGAAERMEAMNAEEDGDPLGMLEGLPPDASDGAQVQRTQAPRGPAPVVPLRGRGRPRKHAG